VKSLGAKTLNYTAPVWIVGTYDAAGKANGMAVSWGGICCSQPPCLSVALRKATHSYASLDGKGDFTVSVPSESQAVAADYFGIATGRETDKFRDTGLTAAKAALVEAPYVAEFPLVYECRVRHKVVIGLHTLFVGEILDVKASEEVLGPDGLPDIGKLRPFVFIAGPRAYHGIGARIGKAFEIGKKPRG
jgi:flavin reductase (DIM6/NTAB) family NADH-FMN oxidoreductase RutF